MDRARRPAGKSGLAVLEDPTLQEAVALDLTLRGADPDLPALPLGRVGALFEILRQDPTSTTARVLGGDGHTLAEHLQYLLLDELRIANWQRSKDGAKGRNRPKPTSPLAQGAGVRIGRTDRSPAEVQALLAQYGPART
ncbi:DUF5361 domain-containing protein [Streptomyces sp. NPDC095602]|uniref:DUF5361 domain-containing protein n=1 Tax=Streptomyces sp. NPDC095602 TaxID=3155819 RepID=UPI0033279C5E